MGLFDFFRKNQPQSTIASNGDNANEQREIPKEVFVEDTDPQDHQPTPTTNGGPRRVEDIYAFLKADYETRAYNDALTNPDDSYKLANIKMINEDLQILVQQVITYYEDLIRELDSHILKAFDIVQVSVGVREHQEDSMVKSQKNNHTIHLQ